MNTYDVLPVQKEIRILANPKRADASMSFFKTKKGDYGFGDIFLGLTVPQSRTVAKKYQDLPFPEIKKLIRSKYHEERLIALLILIGQYKKGNDSIKKTIFDFYLSHTNYINNWDLVDLSAGYIVGDYLLDRDRDILIKLAHSESLWEKRIAIISTFAFTKDLKDAEYTFKIAEILLQDKHDLIHKAVGWMLREVGKRIGEEEEEKFLKKHYKSMPRTMLRYAIERFSPDKKMFYMLR